MIGTESGDCWDQPAAPLSGPQLWKLFHCLRQFGRVTDGLAAAAEPFPTDLLGVLLAAEGSGETG